MFNKNEYWREYYHPFPNPELASREGLLCQGGNLEPDLLLHAYSRGIFPWFSKGDPILWWSPDPRCILLPSRFHLPARSWRKLKKFPFRLSLNSAFEEVISLCANSRPEGTWISADMKEAYIRLYKLGFAHSVEAWNGSRLVGGLYGVSMGNAFFGESMFHIESEASRAALWGLVKLLENEGFSFIDCQQESAHMLDMGAQPMARKEFLALAKDATQIQDKAFASKLRGKRIYYPEKDKWL